jgi:hypothetical protein
MQSSANPRPDLVRLLRSVLRVVSLTFKCGGRPTTSFRRFIGSMIKSVEPTGLLMSKDGSNASGGDFRVRLSVEMDAFDALGPRGRAALNNALFAFSAESIRQALAGEGVSSFSCAQVDGLVEKIILEQSAALLAAAAVRFGLPECTIDARVQPSRRQNLPRRRTL